MKITRLQNKLLLGVLAISLVVTLAAMLAVSGVIRHQYQDQSHALLRKASRIIDEHLADRKAYLLTVSRQLATQSNLGSTIWYLAQFAPSNVDRETLLNTYLQLVKDTYKIGRVAKLSKIGLYDAAGNLVSFAMVDGHDERVGFVERSGAPVFQVAVLKGGEDLTRQALQATNAGPRVGAAFDGPLPQHESVHYAIVDGGLSIESHVPIMGMAFDPVTGKQENKQLGLVATVQPLDQALVAHLSRLTDLEINVFTPQVFSRGDEAVNQTAWAVVPVGAADPLPAITFNEITIAGVGFYQCLMPLMTGQEQVGTLAALYSKDIVQKNTTEMIQTLALIALACLLFMLPLAWYFAISIAHPLTVLSRIFREVAGGKPSAALSAELHQLEKETQRQDELGALTQSFILMDGAVNQKIEQINEINASLEQDVEQRTRELRSANEELTKLATHDVLTGLPNRMLLSDRLRQALTAAKRNQAQMALLCLDLDEFKPVNDTYGHAIGDLLLKETAQRILACVRESDTVARIGGDEFIVLLPLVESEQDARAVAEKIRLALNQPFELAGKSLLISSSTGIALYPQHGSEEGALLKSADVAMYDAKERGRNTVSLL